MAPFWKYPPSHCLKYHLKKYIKNLSRNVRAVGWKWEYVHYFRSFIAKSQLNDLEDLGQCQSQLCTTYSLMIVIICAKYGEIPSRTVHAVERTWQDVPYLSSFTPKSRLNDLEDIGQVLKVLHMTHTLVVLIICAKYRKNPSKTVAP